MLTKIVISIVQTCTRFAATTVLIALGLAVAAGFYTARHFEINTDINTLISPDLDWRKRDIQFDERLRPGPDDPGRGGGADS